MNEHELQRRVLANLRSDHWSVERTAAEHGIDVDQVRSIAASEGVQEAPQIPGLRQRKTRERKDTEA